MFSRIKSKFGYQINIRTKLRNYAFFKTIDPVNIVETALTNFHNTTGLSWASSIIVGTLLLKSAFFPLIVRQIKWSEAQLKHKKYIETSRAEINKLRETGRTDEALEKVKSLSSFMRANNCHPMQFLIYMIPVPVYMSVFFAIRNFSFPLDKSPLFWITNLSLPDETYALPLITSLSIIGIVEVKA